MYGSRQNSHALYLLILSRPLGWSCKLIGLFSLVGQALFTHHKYLRFSKVHLDRVVHHQVDLTEGIDPLGLASQLSEGVSHACKIDHHRHTCQVLQKNSGWLKWNVIILGELALFPIEYFLDIIWFDGKVVAVSHCRLEKDLDGYGQAILGFVTMLLLVIEV